MIFVGCPLSSVWKRKNSHSGPTLESMGFEIEASHHEVAPAQHEIDFKYDNALEQQIIS